MVDRTRLAALVTTEAVVVAGLHSVAGLEGFQVPWSEVGAWLDRAPFEDVVGAVLLLVALALAYWLLISTVAYVLATASGRPRLIRAVDWLTLPPVRRLAGRALALSLAASTVAGPLAPAGANLGGPNAAVPVVVEVGEEGRIRHPGDAGPMEGSDDRVLLPPHLAPQPQPTPPPVEASPAEAKGLDMTVEHTVIVRRGDHMWGLAEAHLRHVTGRIDIEEVASYWVRVIEENRTRIRSGNPDLIYPGESLVLPPVEQ